MNHNHDEILKEIEEIIKYRQIQTHSPETKIDYFKEQIIKKLDFIYYELLQHRKTLKEIHDLCIEIHKKI